MKCKNDQPFNRHKKAYKIDEARKSFADALCQFFKFRFNTYYMVLSLVIYFPN
jgi:hypothetical protein